MDRGEAARLSQSVTDFLENARRELVALKPVSMSWWTAVDPLGTEDISEGGHERWLNVMSDLCRRSETLVRTTRADDIAISEMRRYLKEQEFRTGSTSASTYLQLVGLALLPLRTKSRLDGDMLKFLRLRLDQCYVWLKKATNDLQRKALSIKDGDRKAANAMREDLLEWLRPYKLEQSPVVDMLRTWASVHCENLHSASRRTTNLDQFLREILGCQLSYRDLEVQLEHQIQHDIDLISNYRAKHDGAQQPTSNSAMTCIGEWDVQFRKVVYERMGVVAEPAEVQPAPGILSAIVTDALYWPRNDGEGKSHGILFVNPGILGGNLSPKLRGELGMIVAHELCPGHALHIALGSRSPFSKFFQFGRSSVGLEGWGLVAEEIIAQEINSQALHLAVRAHRLRRLLPVYRTIGGAIKGQTSTYDNINRWITGLPSDLKQWLTPLVGMPALPLLPYVLGWFETLWTTHDRLGNIPLALSAETHRYMRWGPLSPHSIHVLEEDAY